MDGCTSREVSGNGQDFGHSAGRGGVVAFSRILADREVTVVVQYQSDGSLSWLGSARPKHRSRSGERCLQQPWNSSSLDDELRS